MCPVTPFGVFLVILVAAPGEASAQVCYCAVLPAVECHDAGLVVCCYAVRCAGASRKACCFAESLVFGFDETRIARDQGREDA